jgi:hypothetical protein
MQEAGTGYDWVYAVTDDVPVVYTRRRVRDVLRELLTSDSVKTFVWVYYFWFIAASQDLTFYSYPIVLIVDQMGQIVYNAWAWTPLVAAPVALVGVFLRYGGSPEEAIPRPLLRRDFLGLWMQIGGHGCMAVVLAVYIGTAWYGRAPHQPIPSVYWLSAYLMGVGFLAAQCVYKVILGRKR